MRKAIAIGALAFSGLMALPLASALPAQAQSIEVGPRGFRVEPDEDGQRYPPQNRGREEYRERRRDTIGEGEAIAIARSAGMERRLRVSGGFGREWRIIGLDRSGREVRFVIDDRTGRILSRDRE